MTSEVMRRSDKDIDVSIRKNAFAVLGASTRDARARLVELAEERSLSIDSNICAKCRQDLTSPRSRLSVEVAWLPGLSPRKAIEYLNLLDSDLAQLIHKADAEEPLVKANLLCAAIECVSPDESVLLWSELIIDLARATEAIEPSALLRVINEDRQIAGFPEIQGQESVEEALAPQRSLHKNVVGHALDRMDSSKLLSVVGQVTTKTTQAGEQQAPILVDELIDSYRLEVTPFLEAESKNISKVVEATKHAATSSPSKINELLDQLEKLVRNWSQVAVPIQLSMKSRGMEHDLSKDTGYDIRGLSIELFNNHDLMDAATRITGMLREHFQHFPELAERAEVDKQALDDIAEDRKYAELMKPLDDRLIAVNEGANADAKQAAKLARALIADIPDLREQLQSTGVPKDKVLSADDRIAIAIFNCAISYGNFSEDWTVCSELLDQAMKFARSQSVRQKISTNALIVSKNQNLYNGLTPVKSAPSLQTINGIGFTLYGRTDHDAESGSYMATYYFTFFFIPLFPIARYRVTSSGQSYRFLGKGKLRNFDKAHIAISLLLLLYMFKG